MTTNIMVYLGGLEFRIHTNDTGFIAQLQGSLF